MNFIFKIILFVQSLIFSIKINKKIKIYGIIFFNGRGNIFIGEKTVINSARYANPLGGETKTTLIAAKNSVLYIGNNCGISNSTIFCTQKITIENNVLIGCGCKIYDTDFHPLSYTDRISGNSTAISRKPVLIKEGAFIGAHSIILKGVTIGEHSIIGAGSVVTKNIPNNEIWAGNPAHFIKKI